jgi:hypothetical protein
VQPISTINNPFPNVQILKVYSSFEQDSDIIFPIELDNDIFMIRWNIENSWYSNGIRNDMIQAIGSLIEEQFPDNFNNHAEGNLGI